MGAGKPLISDRSMPASVRVRIVGDRPIPAGGGVVPGQVAEIIVALDDEPRRRGSGYRVGPGAVLTAAHVIDGAMSVRVRFDADLAGEWVAEAISCWSDPRSDLAVLTITRARKSLRWRCRGSAGSATGRRCWPRGRWGSPGSS